MNINSTTVQRNKETTRLLLEDAMPNGSFDVIRGIVAPDCVTRRAGFANLYAATGDTIPEKGNFLEWIETGWKPLSEALSDQSVEIKDIIGEGDMVWLQYHYTAIHRGTFVGIPATGRKVEWDEVGIIRFNSDGKIIEMWFMCEELRLARELGFTLRLN